MQNYHLEFAKWLAEKASDEQFAEFFVAYWKEHARSFMPEAQKNLLPEEEGLTEVDMRSCSVDDLGHHIINSLTEILFSDEFCTGAWWKEEKEKVNPQRELCKEVADLLSVIGNLPEEMDDCETLKNAKALIGEAMKLISSM